MTTTETKIADDLLLEIERATGIVHQFADKNGEGIELSRAQGAITAYLQFLQACESRGRLENVSHESHAEKAWGEAFANAFYPVRVDGLSPKVVPVGTGFGTVASNESAIKWPRLRDLPEADQSPFRKVLEGQTCPEIPGVPISEQDAYYPWDYERWKAGLPVTD